MPGFYLSDPNKDFTHPESQELLRNIIAKQGVELTGYELCCVFNGHLPAGTPAECCAYLRPLYQLFRTPQDDYARQLWEDIIWIWLEQERKELIALNQHQRIIDELRRIVHDTLIPSPWLPECGAGVLFTRAHMLMAWMASAWGQHETEDILNTLCSGNEAGQIILLILFIETKSSSPYSPLGSSAPSGAFAAFVERFEKHFHESNALYDAFFRLTDLPMPANDASGSTLELKSLQEECSWYL